MRSPGFYLAIGACTYLIGKKYNGHFSKLHAWVTRLYHAIAVEQTFFGKFFVSRLVSTVHCCCYICTSYICMQAHSSLSQLFVKFLESESSRTTHSTPPSTPTIPGYINPHTDPDRPSLATAPLLSPNPNLTQPGHSSPAPQGKLKDAGLHHGSPSEGKLKDGGPPSQSKLKDTGPHPPPSQSQPKDSTQKQSVLSTPQSSSFQSSLLKSVLSD